MTPVACDDWSNREDGGIAGASCCLSQNDPHLTCLIETSHVHTVVCILLGVPEDFPGIIQMPVALTPLIFKS